MPSVKVGSAWPVLKLIGLIVGENCRTSGWGTFELAGDPPPPQPVVTTATTPATMIRLGVRFRPDIGRLLAGDFESTGVIGTPHMARKRNARFRFPPPLGTPVTGNRYAESHEER